MKNDTDARKIIEKAVVVFICLCFPSLGRAGQAGSTIDPTEKGALCPGKGAGVSHVSGLHVKTNCKLASATLLTPSHCIVDV